MIIKMKSIHKRHENTKSQAWMLRPSGLIKVDGSASTFRGNDTGLGRECFMEANVNN